MVFDYYWCYLKLTTKLESFRCQRLGPKYGFQLIWTLTHIAFLSEFTLTSNFYIDGWVHFKLYRLDSTKFSWFSQVRGGVGSGVKNEDLIWLWKWPFLSICQIINVISWKWSNIEITCHQINFQAQKLVQTLITCSCTTTASSINPIISLFTPSKAYWITKLKNLKIWWMRRVMGWLSGLSFGPRNWSGDKLCQLWIIFRISASQLQIGLSYQGEGMGDPPKFSCPPPPE